jgi:hypothetical protein
VEREGRSALVEVAQMASRPRPTSTLIAVAILVAACGSTASPSPAGSSPAGQAGSTESAAASPAASSAPSPSGDVTGPAGKPSPTTGAAGSSPNPSPSVTTAGWSKPIVVPGLDGCNSQLVAAIDDRGGYHVAATCYIDGPGVSHDWSEIRYSSSPNGQSWTTRTFRPPKDRFDLNPQLAFDGDTLHLAFTRQAPVEGACGDDGMLDVGVLDRSRTLPSGSWSDPKRIGPARDHLQSFRVKAGVIHATVASDDETKAWYERIAGERVQRVRIPDALGPVALRVGDDDRARLAYEGSKGIRFAIVKNDALSAVTIPGSSGGFDPVLVLGPGNVAYAMWERFPHGGGCIDGSLDPANGTYFATNAGGSWSSFQLSKAVGSPSLALDPLTGDVLALVTGEERGFVSMTAYRRTARADWTSERISNGRVSDGVLRVNPLTGTQFVVYGTWSENGGAATIRVRIRI